MRKKCFKFHFIHFINRGGPRIFSRGGGGGGGGGGGLGGVLFAKNFLNFVKLFFRSTKLVFTSRSPKALNSPCFGENFCAPGVFRHFLEKFYQKIAFFRRAFRIFFQCYHTLNNLEWRQYTNHISLRLGGIIFTSDFVYAVRSSTQNFYRVYFTLIDKEYRYHRLQYLSSCINLV